MALHTQPFKDSCSLTAQNLYQLAGNRMGMEKEEHELHGVQAHDGLGRLTSRAGSPVDSQRVWRVWGTREASQRASKEEGKGRISNRPYQLEPLPGAQRATPAQYNSQGSLCQPSPGGWQPLWLPRLDPLKAHKLCYSLTFECLAQFLPYPAFRSTNPQCSAFSKLS